MFFIFDNALQIAQKKLQRKAKPFMKTHFYANKCFTFGHKRIKKTILRC